MKCSKKKIVLAISYPDPKIRKVIESLYKNKYSVILLLWERGLEFPSSNSYEIKKLKLAGAPFGSLIAGLYFPIYWLFLIIHLFRTNADIIHAVNFDSYLVAMIIAKIRKKPIIYDIYDFYSDMISLPAELNNLKTLIKKIDIWAMKFADVLILADESRVKQVGTLNNKDLVIIYNSPREVEFKYTSTHDSKNITIFYGGGVGKDRGIEDIITAIDSLENVQLNVMGYCGYTDYREKLAKKCNNRSNINLFLNAVPHDEIIKNTLNSDLLFALYDPAIPNNKYASPNKLFEAMMCGKPILVSDGTSMAKLVNRHKLGIVVPYGDVKSIRKAILSIKSNPRFAKELGENGKRAFHNFYSWNIMEKKLLNVYDKLDKGS